MWPQECIGFILETSSGQTYVPLHNAHPDPEEHACAHPGEVAEVLTRGTLHGIHHSHTRCEPATRRGMCPSFHDMVEQERWQVPHYITCVDAGGRLLELFGWGDQLPVPPLKQREFRNGVTDCYAMVRHVRWALDGVLLPDGPRSDLWWERDPDENPIMGNLTGKGFKEVPLTEVEPGDGLLFSFKRGVVAHCGAYIGRDLFAHHLHARLSRVDPLPQWRKFLAMAVRYAPGAEE